MPRAERPFREETSRVSPYILSTDTALQNTSTYTPINSENGDIRLLELAPGKFDDQIVMHLIPSNLSDESHPYEALSYVWGTAIASRNAMLSGRPTTITSNLESALRHLRGTLVKRTLWVDAVSMNQRDTQERNHQVRIMGKIYSSAQGVIIWLGTVSLTDLHLRAVLGAMQFQFATANSFMATLFDYTCSVITLMHEQVGERVDAEKLVLDAIRRLISRPWFSRLWVVQELALAKRAIIRIGDFNFPWEPFESFIQWLPDHKADVTSHPQLVNAARTVAKMARSRAFPNQLLRTIHLTASDARDKVFGILGISTFSGPAIEPDYTRSTQQVISQAMCIMVEERRLIMYYYMPLQPRTKAERARLGHLVDLPSWIPDLRIEGASYHERPRPVYQGESDHRPPTILPPLGSWFSHCEEWFHCKVGSVPICPARISKDRTKLVAPGIAIGTIAHTFPVQACRGETDSSSHLPQSIYHLYVCVKDSGIDAVRFVDAVLKPRSEVGQTYQDRYRRRAAACLFNSDEFEADQSEEVAQAMQDLISEIIDNTSNRICFVTADQNIGITHHPDPDNGVRVGDLVVGLFGINFPFILRPTTKSKYIMVNVTGLHDHTWGHAFWKQTSDRKSGNASWKDYKKHGMKEYVIV